MKILGRYLFVKEGCPILGRGQIQLLEAVLRCGSLKAAAENMHMSYSKAWRITKSAEETIGKPLMTKTAGEIDGGSSVLTEFGEHLVRAYEGFTAEADPLLEEIFKKYFKEFIE